MCDCKETGVQPAQVETYSGYRLHEHPRHFTFQGERLEVRRILARWQEPEKLSFLVAAHDSRQFLLKYHQCCDTWEVLPWRGPDLTGG